MAEGIVKRHSKGCRSRQGGRCNCNAGYEAWVFLPKEKRKVRKTFRREAEARSWRAEALVALNSGEVRAPSRITVEQAAWLWLEAAYKGVVRDRSGNIYKLGTLREYQRALRLRLLTEFGQTRLSEVTRSDLQDFVDRLMAAELAPSTTANTLNPLQAIYRHAVRRGIAAANPTRDLELPRARGRRNRIATAAEAKRLVETLPPDDQPIWATAFYAGLRRGELQALRGSDVDLTAMEISVRRAWDQYEGPIAPKSKAGIRTVPILGVLRRYLSGRIAGIGSDDLILGRGCESPFAPKAISDRAKRAWRLRGIPGLSGIPLDADGGT